MAVDVDGDIRDTAEQIDSAVQAARVAHRSGAPESAVRQHDEPRIDRRHSVVTEAELLEHPGGKDVDDHVADASQAAHDISTLSGRHVDGDALLRRIELVEIAARVRLFLV